MNDLRPLTAQVETLLFIICLSNAGGQGKTTMARLIKALLELAGNSPVLLDGDQGNAAASSYDPEAEKLGWGVQPSDVPEILQAYQGRHVILDIGANTLASKREIVDTIQTLILAFSEAGYHCLGLLPVSPNKRGAVENLIAVANRLPAMEKVIVQNDLDGSGNFEEYSHQYPCAQLQLLDPGFMDYVNSSNTRSFCEAVINPGADRKLAAEYIGRWMRDFAVQLPRREVFEAAITALSAIPSPKKNRFRIKQASDTSDVKLIAYQKKTDVIGLLDKYGWNTDGLRRSAEHLNLARV